MIDLEESNIYKTEVSILVPVFNHGEFLNSFFNSLLMQSYPDLELILINDGSTDNSLDVIESRRVECEYKFKKFTLVNQVNKGVATSLNLAIKLARNEFLFIIASDDLVKPNSVSKLLSKILLDNEVAAIFSDSDFIDALGKSIPIKHEDRVFETYRKYLSFCRPDVNFELNFGEYRTLLNGNYLGIGILARKSCITGVGGYDENCMMEDYDLWLKLSKKYKLKFYDEILTHKRWHGNNSSLLFKNEIHFSEACLLIREAEEFIRLGDFSAWKRRMLDSIYGYKSLRDNEISQYQFTSEADFKVIDWGPVSCISGNVPNMQPDGSMGIWISVENMSFIKGCELFFGSHPADLTQVGVGLVTAKISKNQILEAGTKEVTLVKQIFGGKIIFDIGTFFIN